MTTENKTEAARFAVKGIIANWTSKASWKRYAAILSDKQNDEEAITLRREAVVFENCAGELHQALKGLLE